MKIKYLYHTKAAFTMLELIMVIVILGIVSSIGASVIANVYESYIVQRALYNTTSKTELAVQQIANRLADRISISVIGKRTDGVYLPIEGLPTGTTDYQILEWFSADTDSFSNAIQPGWSGFCDVDNPLTTRTNLVTQGSQLTSLSTIYTNLGSSITDAAIIFNGPEYYSTLSTRYDEDCIGYANDTCIAEVTSITDNSNMAIEDKGAITVRDQYKLIRSAYALVPTAPNADGIFDLNLYYNYQPWKGETYLNGDVSTLVSDISVFKFKGEKEGDTIRFKICAIENIGNSNISSCKEKAVIR